MKLIVDHLSCARGMRIILADVNFTVAQGEGLLLRGANGAGKTTLLRTLAGFISPRAGRIALEGEDARGREIAELSHYVGHLNGVKAGFTVVENLRFVHSYLGSESEAQEETIESALEAFALSDLRHIPAGLLSAGQKRRLGLARLTLARRPLWLLDEPSVSLDSASQEVLAGLVHAHVGAGGLVVAASHVPLGIDFTQVLEVGGGAARLIEGAAA